MSVHEDLEFTQAGAATTAVAAVSAWPLFVVWGLSAAAFAVALFNEFTWSLVAYGALLLAGVALLIMYRMSVVRASMSASGGALGVLAFERITVLAIVLGCVANGVVIGLWVGGLELWFQ